MVLYYLLSKIKKIAGFFFTPIPVTPARYPRHKCRDKFRKVRMPACWPLATVYPQKY